MKRKKWMIAVCVIAAVLLLCVAAVLIAAGIISEKGYGVSRGLFYADSTGAYLIEQPGGAMRLSDRSGGQDLFAKLSNGDEVLVVHDWVLETYPAQTGAYAIVRLAEGDASYRPADDILGIVHTDPNGEGDATVPQYTRTVTYSNGTASISLKLPAGWACAKTDDGTNISLEIWPEEYTQGKLSVKFYSSGFGVCGTGLSTKEIRLGTYAATQGTYDDAALWDFISIDGHYAVINEGAETWWDGYGRAAMQILETLTIGE